jgi:hypothetical protein
VKRSHTIDDASGPGPICGNGDATGRAGAIDGEVRS